MYPAHKNDIKVFEDDEGYLYDAYLSVPWSHYPVQNVIARVALDSDLQAVVMVHELARIEDDDGQLHDVFEHGEIYYLPDLLEFIVHAYGYFPEVSINRPLERWQFEYSGYNDEFIVLFD